MANPDTGLAPWPPGIIGDTQNYTMLVASVPWQPPLTLQGEGNVGGGGGGGGSVCLSWSSSLPDALQEIPVLCPPYHPPQGLMRNPVFKKNLKLQAGGEAACDLNALGSLWGPWSTTVVQGVSIGARLTLAADH